MNRKISLGLALAAMLVVAALAVSLTMAASWSAFNRSVGYVAERQQMYKRLDEIDQIVRQHALYDVDEAELETALGRGYIAGIGDRYANYLTAEESAKRTAQHAGKSYGIGLSVSQDPDSQALYVNLVHVGSPSERAGLLKGDRITAVDGTSVEEVGYSQAVSLIQGEVDTVCKLDVLRDGQPMQFEVLRGNYTSTTVTGRMIGRTALIQIVGFDSNTDEQFTDMYEKLTAEDPAGLIIDLRNNLGGTLDSTETILDFLLPEGLLYSTVYRDGRQEDHQSDEICTDLPMVLLVNGNSASASELFAGAVQDFGAGTLVGTVTYGKGVMQNTYALKDSAAVVLTFAYFNLPKGENYDGVGLTPDIEVTLTEEQTKRFYQLTDEEDPQLQRALEVLQTAAD